MMSFFENISKREKLTLAAVLLIALLAPLLVNDYLLSVLIIILYFCFVGTAWNLMMGMAGQLSLGHALYVGLGAYMSAALFVHFGVPPLVGMFPAMLLAALVGAFIGLLAFRFGIDGVYFALLTIAFAEFTRILFSHFEWVGSTGGLFLPVSNRSTSDVINLRGQPMMFYYVILALTVLGLGLVYYISNSRLGYYFRAIREDQEAAQASGINTFRIKMIAVMISAAMTSLSGVFLAFYYNNLFPSDIFSMERSIEIILAPIIGGLGTLIGPILGAFILGGLGETLTGLIDHFGIKIVGAKQLFYAVILILVIKYLPGGIWPSLQNRWRALSKKEKPE